MNIEKRMTVLEALVSGLVETINSQKELGLVNAIVGSDLPGLTVETSFLPIEPIADVRSIDCDVENPHFTMDDNVERAESKQKNFQNVQKLVIEYRTKIQDTEMRIEIAEKERVGDLTEYGRESVEHRSSRCQVMRLGAIKSTLIQAKVDIEALGDLVLFC